MANLLLATLKEPPRTGTLRGFVLTMLLVKREENELAKWKAMVQAIVKPDAGPASWDAYFKTAFPWVEVAKGREKDDFIKRLKEEISRGPLEIKKQKDDKAFRSRLKAKVVSREEIIERPPIPLKSTIGSPNVPRYR